MAGQHLFQPPNVAGWDESRWLDTRRSAARWWLANYALERFTKDPDEDAGTEPLNAAKLVDRAAAFWGSPTITRPTRNALTTFARRPRDRGRELEGETYLLLIQNALRQLIAISLTTRPADDHASCHCTGLSRSRLLRRAAAEAGAGCPRSRRACPCRPEPASTGAPSSSARRSLPLRLRGSKLGFRPSRRGGGGLEPAGPRARVGLPRGWRRLADPLPRRRLALPESPPDTRASGRRRHALLGGQPAPLASGRGAARDAHAEGKVSAPGDRLYGPDQSPLHVSHREVGATSASLRTGWIGRYLDRVGTADNPLQGLSLDWSLQPSLATGRVPVATLESPDGYDFWARDVWGEVEERMLPGSDRSAPPTRSRRTPRFAPPARSRSSPTGSAGSSAASTRRRPVPYPEGGNGPSAWPRSPR